MKRIYTLIALLGLAAGMMLTGCNKEASTSTDTTSTNAPTPTPPPASTNK